MKYLKKIIAVVLAAGMIISNAPVAGLQTRTAGHLRELIIGMISVLTILMRIILMKVQTLG